MRLDPIFRDFSTNIAKDIDQRGKCGRYRAVLAERKSDGPGSGVPSKRQSRKHATLDFHREQLRGIRCNEVAREK